MKDDFDNGMGLPEDELTGSTSMSDPGDLGLGGMDAEDEMDSGSPGRPSGGARARSSSGSRARKGAAASPGGAKGGGAKKKSAARGAKKSASSGARRESAGR